jgi:hypothetical protein
MAIHTELTSAEAADRLALHELFDAYAHCADRRDAEGQTGLFTDDTVFAVFMDGGGSEPTYVFHKDGKRLHRSSRTSIATRLRRTSEVRARSPSMGTAPRARATRSLTTSTAKTARAIL